MAEAPAGKEPVPSSDESVLTLEDLSNELEPVADWHTLGVKLRVEYHKLREIEEQYHDPQRRKHEVLSRWLRKGQNCTWRRVVEVLMLMGEMRVADAITLKYLTLSTGPQTPPDPTSPVVAAVMQRNRMIIGRKWGALVAHTDKVLQNKLNRKKITSSGFRLFLSNLYSSKGKMNGDQFLRKLLKPSASISEMLETLTVEGEWGFLNYYLLESIIEEYGDNRTKKMMEQYKQDLTGYLLVTMIKDHLDAVDLEHPTIPPEELYSSLTIKLKGVNISSQSLKYVNDLWESLRIQFSLPKYMLVLYKIAKGCLEISWCVPVKLAAYIIRKAKYSEQYFEEQQFLRVSVDGLHIYNKTEAGVQLKDKFPQMRWKTLRRAPEKMRRGATAVDGNTVYITPGYTHHVWAYDLRKDKWTRLPDCPQRNAGLVMVNGLLTAVGGRTNDGDVTKTLMSLTESRSGWTEHFKPMAVNLVYPAVVCTGNHLLVIDASKNVVYVMDTTSLKWFSAGSLPLHWPVLNYSLSVCGKELYVLTNSGSPAVFSCSLPTLLQSSSTTVQPETTDMWRRVADVPVKGSTLTTLRGQLVAVGGRNELSEPVDTIHLYNPSMDSWHIIGHMPTAQYDCLVATLPGDTLVVRGGFAGMRSCDFVEVAYPV